MAKEGWDVTVIERHDTPGGRARQHIENGFTFDMGPSFYWMPDVFERYFSKFGRKVSDYYTLQRLDPSYRVYWHDGHTDLPANYDELKKVFESLEPGSASRLDEYLRGAAYKYEVGINNLVYKPGLSFTEFIDWPTISGMFRLQVFSSIKKHIERYFRHPRLRQVMEFPVLFLGALPQDTPALYSLMNYADIKGGTWYPQGGMYSVVKGMYELAIELGVRFHFNEDVKSFSMKGKSISEVITDKNRYHADVIISGADYHFTEKNLLPAEFRTYSEKYWNKRVMAPSCLLYYIGLNKKIKQPVHHALFFDTSFEKHGQEIYKDPQWPSEPLFYVSVSSITDNTVAPEGHENLVLLVPIAAGLEGDTETLREKFFNSIVDRLEKHWKENIREYIVYKKTYSVSDFVHDYNSFRGNAYGLANTLMQTAVFRPICRSRKVKNLFFTGQLTVPGPGVPPSLISGEVVAEQVNKTFALNPK